MIWTSGDVLPSCLTSIHPSFYHATDTCSRYWADQQHEGHASTQCVQPLSMADCNSACNQDAACLGVDWYQVRARGRATRQGWSYGSWCKMVLQLV